MTTNQQQTTPTRTVDAHWLRSALEGDEQPTVVDVRTPGEFEAAHIPGAWCVPLDTVREHRGRLGEHLDRDAVLICRSGARAEQAEQALAGAGLPGVRVLEGGMTAWESAGGQVRRGRQVWDLERQVRFAAGSLVAVGALGSLLVPALVWLAAFVGLGLVFAAVTNTCAMGMAIAKLPWNRASGTPSIDEVLTGLRGGEVR